VDPQRLKHFVALAEERSFTRAAAREFIVQSGLSASIRALEADLDVELYVKGTRPVRLTAEGEALIPAARHALDALQLTYRAVDAVRGRLSGRLRMGVFQSADHLVPVSATLAGLIRDHPALDLALMQAPSRDMLAMVAAGELDCAIISAASGANGVEILPLAEEPFDLVVPGNHPLATHARLRLRDLAGQPFIETAPGFASRTISDLAFSAEGIERRIICEANEWSLVADLITAGLGIGLLPRGLAEQSLTIKSRDLVRLHVEDLHLTRRIDLALANGHAATPAARELAKRLHASPVHTS
jgi:DNA-binding transcriptional LysR family regulator